MQLPAAIRGIKASRFVAMAIALATILLAISNTHAVFGEPSDVRTILAPTACTQGVLLERWDGINGRRLTRLFESPAYPDSPTTTGTLTSMEIPIDNGNAYGVRLRAHITPPTTGTYTFWIASDNEGRLLLSSDNTAGNATQIATVSSYTGSRQWFSFAEQQSTPVTLTAGTQYYIEALMKEGGGGDNLAVAWSNSGNPQVIGGADTCVYEEPNVLPTASISASTLSGDAPLSVSFDGSGSADADGTIVDYAWDFGDGNTGTGLNVSHVFSSPGTYTVQLTVTDDRGDTATDSVTISAATPPPCTTGAYYERWEGIGGSALTDLTGNPAYPFNPSSVSSLATLEIPQDNADNYGVRLRTYVVPATTDTYTFWIASDDQSELKLSTDADPANATVIATVPSYTASRQWTRFPEQQSAGIALQAGVSYYLDVIMKEGGGGDNLAVAWSTTGSPQVIGGSELCIYEVSNNNPTASISASPLSGSAPLLVSLDASGSTDADGSIVSYAWDFDDGSTGSGATQSHTFANVGTYNVQLTVTDDLGATDTISQSIVVSEAACNSGLYYERFENIPGLAIADMIQDPSYPNNPTATTIIANFEAPADLGDDYGIRVRGTIVPATSGTYTFWMASDDNGELYLSTDANESNASLIASVPGWTNPGEYDKYPEQSSAGIVLTAGQSYYVEALMKEFSGGDHMTVAWQLNGGTRQLIGNSELCAFQQIGSAPTANISANPTSGTAPLVVSFDASGSTDADGSITSYAWEFGDGATGSGATTSHTYSNAGVYTARLTVTDNTGRSDSTTVLIDATDGSNSCTSSGLLYERFENISGTSLVFLYNDSSYPNSPTFSDTISDFEAPPNVGDNYGARVRGYLLAPTTGTYTFWIATDDNGSLMLSSDANPANATEIAYISSWVGPRQWDLIPEQQSAAITLQGGEVYYIEALVKEAGGGDNLAVAWQTPGGTREIIPSYALCPLVSVGEAPTAGISATPETGDAPLNVSFSGSPSSDPDGSIVTYSWDFGDGSTGSGMNVQHTYSTPGNYIATLTVTDNDGRFDSAEQQILVTTPGGGVSCNTAGVYREQWNSMFAGTVDGFRADPRFPDLADSNSIMTDFEAPSNIGDMYGARMRAYIVAPTTGNYTFWVASAHISELLLSSDVQPSNAVKIAEIDWSPQNGFDFRPSQKSAPIFLQAGETYYIEYIHVTTWGAEYASVAWTPPGGSREIIPGTDLCAYSAAGSGRDAAADAASNAQIPQLAYSDVAQSLPTMYLAEMSSLLISNQPLRDATMAARDQLLALLASGGTIDAAFVSDMTALYNDWYAVASPGLQAWLAQAWALADLDSYIGQASDTTYTSVNAAFAASVPTAVTLTQSAAANSMMPILLVSLMGVLAWATRHTWRRSHQ